MILAHDKCDSWEKKVNELEKKIEDLKFLIECSIDFLNVHSASFSSLNRLPVMRGEFTETIRLNEEFVLKLKEKIIKEPTKAFDYSTGMPLE